MLVVQGHWYNRPFRIRQKQPKKKRKRKKPRDSASQQAWHKKDSSLVKSHKRRPKAAFLQPITRYFEVSILVKHFWADRWIKPEQKTIFKVPYLYCMKKSYQYNHQNKNLYQNYLWNQYGQPHEYYTVALSNMGKIFVSW